MVHKVWLYFTQYAWVSVEASTYAEAEAIAWAWDTAGFPMGENKPAEIVDWGR